MPSSAATRTRGRGGVPELRNTVSAGKKNGVPRMSRLGIHVRVKEDRCVPMLKALADQTRWQIVNALLARPANVTELTEKLKVSQYNISKHLRILREERLVVSERHGKEVVCSIAADFRS